MQHQGDYFIVSVYKDIAFCLTHYGQLTSHLVSYLFYQWNLLLSLARDM